MLELASVGFFWHHWEGDVVIYDTSSGDTHSVMQPGGLIVSALEQLGPVDAAALARHLQISSQQNEHEFEEALETLLNLKALTQRHNC